MSIRRHSAPIRFGLGLRLGETPPADPAAWLAEQLARPGPVPTGPSVEEAMRLTHEVNLERRERRAMEAAQLEAAARTQAEPRAQAPTPSPGGMEAPDQPRDKSAALNRLVRDEGRQWVTRRLTTAEPFRERLVDFWMNHFTVSRRTVGPLVGMLERDSIRPHVTGRFADMLVAVTSHPAMLIYLDNHLSIGPDSPANRNRRRGLNENLAREVLELHTLSPSGGYTQGDVQELARILTGWSVLREQEPYGFRWRPEAHDPGPKTLLGRRFPEGEGSQEAALRFLAQHPATWRHLAVKLARHFVADEPPPEAVRRLEAVLRQTDGDLGATAQALVELPQAWNPPLAKFRTPYDFALAAARAVGLERPDPVLGGMFTLGQPLWTAPQPNGWGDTASAWMGPEAMMRRIDWIYTLAGGAARVNVAAATEAALGPFARAETVSAMRVAGSTRDALTLLLGSPEFMHR
jgi:uncharacterized protein (DUF1800 family)